MATTGTALVAEMVYVPGPELIAVLPPPTKFSGRDVASVTVAFVPDRVLPKSSFSTMVNTDVLTLSASASCGETRRLLVTRENVSTVNCMKASEGFVIRKPFAKADTVTVWAIVVEKAAE